MIVTFKDPEAELIFTTGTSKRYGELARTAARRLGAISFAKSLEDLRSPPGNRLERLKGDRNRQYSIRINDQDRVCFRWDGEHAHEVEIVDYH